MTPRGAFTITPTQGAEWRVGPAPAGLIVPSSDRYDNGFQEQRNRDEDTAPGVMLEGKPEQPLFGRSPGRFFLLPAGGQPTKYWYYRDDAARYFLRRRGDVGTTLVIADGHPAARRFHVTGVRDPSSLYAVAEQSLSDEGKVLTANLGDAKSNVVTDGPQIDNGAPSVRWQGVRFDARSPYASYHWELFLHLPMLFAEQLARQQRYSEAERWLRLVLDPTSEEARKQFDPDLYWRFLPFRQAGRPHRIEQLVEWLADPDRSPEAETDFKSQIKWWQENPFRPHGIARLRPGAYQWDVVFAYLDLLLAAGDDLFHRDTREAVAEATSYYVRAAEILGPRPNTVERTGEGPLTYRSAAGSWEDFANTWYTLADTRWARSRPPVPSANGKARPVNNAGVGNLTGIGRLYFCVPANPRIDEYRTRVEQRLDNIRHSRNIEGVERQLALFAPRIDPELLVRAVAAGLDVGQVLAEGARPLPPYRFGTLAQKATELCGQVQALGGAVLAALEKHDAERLSALRSSHEVAMLELVTEARRDQLRDAQANRHALQASRELVESRYSHHQYLITGRRAEAPERDFRVSEEAARLQLAGNDDEAALALIEPERTQLQRNAESANFALGSGIAHAISAVSHMVPDPTGTAERIANAATATGHAYDIASKWAASHAGRDATIAGYQRRRAEWIQASNAALRELAQIDRQAVAADIRHAIATQELANHEQQLDRAREADAFLRDKYTNQQLYGWMSGQLGSVYFSAYRLATDVARQAERALRFELHEPTTQFIRPPAWDGLHKGLLAGERLAQDLKRMEVAYLERNRREHELTRTFSLRDVAPWALLDLRETGKCDLDLPELLFDADAPGLYLRRLKSVGLTLPCVVGPSTAVHCRLTLTSSRLRVRPDYGAAAVIEDHVLAETVITSGAVDAVGMFEPNLRDERRLPFEGRGADSSWSLELPAQYRQFDYATIIDARLTVRYTARDGGVGHRDAAIAQLDAATSAEDDKTLALLVSLRHEFPQAWTRLTAAAGGVDTVKLTIARDRFPSMLGRREIIVGAVDVVPVLRDNGDAAEPTVTVTPTGDVTVDDADGAEWTLQVSDGDRTRLRDMHLVLSYHAKKSQPDG